MNYTLAGFYSKSSILNKLLFLYESNPFIFKNNITISSLYDSLPNLKWNGGRVVNNQIISKNIIFENILNINNMGIGINFTFTNSLITEKDLTDKKCNEVLQILSKNTLNGVIVSSGLLANYIAKKYPSLKITLSLTYFYYNVQNIFQELLDVVNVEIYDKIVLPPDYNKNYLLLNSIKNKDKIELLINETCYKNCKYRAEHYQLINQDNIKSINMSKNFCHKKYKNIKNSHELVMSEKNINYYKSINIKNFKIAGRTLDDEIYISFLYSYLIKEEYKNFFFEQFDIFLKDRLSVNNINFLSKYTKKLVW